ncbi:MFS transporter [bacterium]|jgi:MFS family permease|nr:MFS transporter [bacterium]MBT6832407.1 MFS transporter [bacterium]MBT6996078.1 MFS transporter [bacterium]MBT7772527.1 MFS transporter [bacterium]
MKSEIAEKNIKIQAWINFLAGIVFLIPIVTLFYKFSGLSLLEIVLISNVTTFSVWIFELPTSVFADTLGRKKSLVISVICNFLSALTILIFPSFGGFLGAAIFSGLYWSFWSGTGQAFLEENLRVLGKTHEFGKKIGHFMSLERLAGIFTPLAAAGILKIFSENGYQILAILDVIFALILVFLTVQLRENFLFEKWKTFGELFQKNYEIAKSALQNVFQNKNLRIFLIYRSLSSHVGFLFVISLPVLTENGMQEYFGGILTAIAGVAMLITNKFTYKFAEKKSYHFAWVFSTISQAVLLIFAGFFLKSWIFFAVIFVIFNFFEGIWMPAWNHVLVEQTKGIALATTRSVIFSVFALYITIGKQFLSFFPVSCALIGSGVFIILINIFLARKILALRTT